MTDLYDQWLAAFRSIDVKVIDPDTAARILAVLMIYGNNEQMVYSPKFRSECRHIQQSYGIDGGDTPDPEVCELLKAYARELEASDEPPQWARDLYMKRYQIKLFN